MDTVTTDWRKRRSAITGLTQEQVEALPCPSCGVGAGLGCRTRTGYIAAAHEARVVAAGGRTRREWRKALRAGKE